MFDHVTVRVSDLEASKRFYDLVFAPVAGFRLAAELEDRALDPDGNTVEAVFHDR